MSLRGGERDLGGGVEVRELGAKSVRLHYRSGWNRVYLHLSRDEGKTWTIKPDQPQPESAQCESKEEDPVMTDASVAGAKWKSVVLENVEAGGKGICFVLHDGKGDWDSSPRSSSGETFYRIEGPGEYCLMGGLVSKVTPNLPAVLLVTDLDGTLVGDAEALAAFNDEWQRQLAHRKSVLVFNTGRSINSTLALMAEQRLLVPTAVVGSVGTEIWWFKPDGSHWPDREWEQALMAGGGEGGGKWDRKVALAAAQPFIAKEWMHLRPEDEQNQYKLVFGAKSKHVEAIIAEMEAKVKASGAAAKFIYSGHGDWNYLDVVCPGAGKLEAMLYVRRKLGFGANCTVACGDSGNDILMLSGEERAVVVGNAQAGLLEWVERYKQGDEGRQADAGARLFCATEGHAKGILQGLRHMGFAASHP